MSAHKPAPVRLGQRLLSGRTRQVRRHLWATGGGPGDTSLGAARPSWGCCRRRSCGGGGPARSWGQPAGLERPSRSRGRADGWQGTSTTAVATAMWTFVGERPRCPRPDGCTGSRRIGRSSTVGAKVDRAVRSPTAPEIAEAIVSVRTVDTSLVNDRVGIAGPPLGLLAWQPRDRPRHPSAVPWGAAAGLTASCDDGTCRTAGSITRSAHGTSGHPHLVTGDRGLAQGAAKVMTSSAGPPRCSRRTCHSSPRTIAGVDRPSPFQSPMMGTSPSRTRP